MRKRLPAIISAVMLIVIFLAAAPLSYAAPYNHRASRMVSNFDFIAEKVLSFFPMHTRINIMLALDDVGIFRLNGCLDSLRCGDGD